MPLRVGCLRCSSTSRRGWRPMALGLLALCVACGGGPQVGGDAGRRDADTAGCTSDLSCDDGLFCNGEERCVEGECVLGAQVLCADDLDCTSDRCDEERRACVHEAPDADGDGHATIECGGDDCDDDDEGRFPGNIEVCDDAKHDEDCDPTTFGFRDADGDGWPDATCCNVDGSGAEVCGTDCDDSLPSAHPSEAESCDGVDNDCDGEVDEGVKRSFFVDADGDRHGVPGGGTTEACFVPEGYAEIADDCDDADASVHPGATERCDAADVDEDCDGTSNPASLCNCTTGTSEGCVDPGVCSAGTRSCSGGSWGACSIAPSAESCNGLDDDCDGLTDEGLTVTCFADADGDGFATAGATDTRMCPVTGRDAFGGCPVDFTDTPPLGAARLDCDDTDATRAPGRMEVCDGVDNDCDGGVDEGLRVSCFVDADRDGVPVGGASSVCPAPGTMACPAGMTAASPASAGVDCDDADATRFPGAVEVCDGAGVDEDCDGLVNEGLMVTCYADSDGDGLAASGASGVSSCPAGAASACAAGFTIVAPDSVGSTDCDDSRADVSPLLPEVCDGRDNDCDEMTDEGVTVTRYRDADGDGFGAGVARQVCPGRAGMSDNDADCNDRSAAVFPGNSEGRDVPVCPSGWTTCVRQVVVGSPALGINSVLGCRSPAGTGTCDYRPEWWDYDCTGSVEPVWPVASACVSTSAPRTCGTVSDCSGSTGFAWDSRLPGPPCGLTDPDVSWSACVCVGSGGDHGCAGQSRTSPYRGAFACR